MKGIPAALSLCLFALTACNKTRPPETGIAIGSLVCPDSSSLAGARSVALPDRCPLLVVGIDRAKGMVRALGQAEWDERFALTGLRKVGEADFPGTVYGILSGATDSAINRTAPSPNAGTVRMRSDFGLLFAKDSGGPDTVFPGDLPALQTFAPAVPDIGACLERLGNSPAYGFLRAPFAPFLKCGAGSVPIWLDRGDSGAIPTSWAPGKDGFSLEILAKPDPRLAKKQDWIFLATGDWHWVWRMNGGPARIVEVPFMEKSEIESVAAEDIDGDSLPELIVHMTTYYGDGQYSVLHVIRERGDRQDRRDGAEPQPPRIGALGFDGSSGEESGSTVESGWWIRAPRLYHAYAQEGNDGGNENSHDLRIDAYRFSDAGVFGPEKKRGLTVAVFGPHGSRWAAQAHGDSLTARWPEALAAGIHPLPRLTSNGIAWQAGAVAPDLQTAERWKEWDSTRVILGLTR